MRPPPRVVTIRHRSLISSGSDGADEVEPLAEVAEWVAIAGGVTALVVERRSPRR